MKIDSNKIQKFEIFNDLNNDDIQLFSEKMQFKSYSKNDIIMQEGDDGHSLLFLLNGEINITKALTLSTNKNNDDDNRQKEFIRCKSEYNIIIGEISLFSEDSKRTATVKALTDCEIAYLEREDFFKICDHNSSIGYKAINNLTKIITKRLIDTNHQVLKLTTAFSLIVDN
jgi:CRP-like cAMP-binding protein